MLHSSADLAYPARWPSLSGGAFSLCHSWLLFMVCRAAAACGTAQQSWYIWHAGPAFLATVPLLPLARCSKWFAGPAPLAPQLQGLGVSGALAQPSWRRFLCLFRLAVVASRGLPGRRRLRHNSSALAYLARRPGISGDSSSASFGSLPKRWFAGPAPLAPQLSRLGVSGSLAQPSWRRFLCWL